MESCTPCPALGLIRRLTMSNRTALLQHRAEGFAARSGYVGKYNNGCKSSRELCQPVADRVGR
jgi:hypothetical protein